MLSLAAASVVSRLPVGMVAVALVIFVHDRTGSFGIAGAVAAAYTIGLGGTAPLLGRLVDRRGPWPVLVPSASSPAPSSRRRSPPAPQIAGVTMPPGTGTEVFTWLSLSIVVGASAGSALAGPLVQSGGWRAGVVLAAALPALGLPLTLGLARRGDARAAAQA